MNAVAIKHQQPRLQYSSYELDKFHRGLMQSENEDDLIHGLLSVVFWGFSSGVGGRLNTPRALSRAKAIAVGTKNAPPQPINEIIAHLKRSRQLLNASQITGAFLEARQIKFLQMSFASKLLTFMDPNVAAVYDAIISLRLEKDPEPEPESYSSAPKCRPLKTPKYLKQPRMRLGAGGAQKKQAI